jgi:hypothetical protein
MRPVFTMVEPRTAAELAEEERQRGEDAAVGDVDLQELAEWPGLDFLIGYFSQRHHNPALGHVLARVMRECRLWEIEEVLAAVQDLPVGAVNAINRALVGIAQRPGGRQV